MRCPGESGGAEVAGEGPLVGDDRVPQVVGGGHLRHDPAGMKLNVLHFFFSFSHSLTNNQAVSILNYFK